MDNKPHFYVMITEYLKPLFLIHLSALPWHSKSENIVNREATKLTNPWGVGDLGLVCGFTDKGIWRLILQRRQVKFTMFRVLDQEVPLIYLCVDFNNWKKRDKVLLTEINKILSLMELTTHTTSTSRTEEDVIWWRWIMHTMGN